MQLTKFVEKWCHPDYPPVQFDIGQFHAAEEGLKITFPLDYLIEVRNAGFASPTLALSTGIEENDLDIMALSELYAPEQILEQTHGWRGAGMPIHLIAIGSDLGGSHFCFDERDLRAAPVKTAPIYFWDHDFGETEKIADSFPDWIGSFLQSWSDGLTFRDF